MGPDGDLYVSGRDPVTLDYEVFVVHTDGTVELLFTPPDIWIASLATDSLGRIFNSQSDAIRVYEPNGMGGEAVNIAGVGDGMGNLILGPRGIAVGPNDEIYSVSFYEDSAFRAHSVPEPDMVAILAALIPALAALDRRRLRGAEG